MKDIIQTWLRPIVGAEIETENLEKALSDGVVLAKLLHHYHIVNKKTIKHILPSDNPKVCENNLCQLRVWFDLLGIKFDNDIISSIINGKATICLKLLYELFIVLHKKKRLQFVNIEKENISKQGFQKKFSCKSLRDRSDTEIQKNDTVPEQISCESLSEEGTITKLTRFEVTDNNFRKREDVLTLRERTRIEDIRFVRTELNKFSFTKVNKKKDKTSQAYLALLESVRDMNEELDDEETEISKILEPDLVLGSLISSENLTLHDESREKTLERNQLKESILQNVVKQSEYEKKLSTKFQTAKENILELKVEENTSSDYFNFFSTCRTSEEEINFQLDGIRKMELHRKLYDEKIRKRNKKRFALCQQIVKDIVDFAIKISEHGKECVTDELWSEWKALFILGTRPLLDPDNVSDTGIPVIRINETLGPEEIIKNEQFDEYHHLVGDWFKFSGSDVSYDDLRIIANMLHRLQDTKVPQVALNKPADIPRYSITSVINGSFDELAIVKLKTLLFKSKILIVDIQAAINFCVDRYKLEADIKPPEPPSKKGKTPVKSKGGPGNTGGTAKKKNKNDLPRPAAFKDEEVQTNPSLLEIDKLKELSDVAQVGMQLFGLNSTDLSTECIVNTLIAYIKSQRDIEGWVMINFPSTLNEAYNLETTLTGKKFPQVFYVKEENLEEDNALMTIGRLVHLPFIKMDEFNTYLTSFINVIEKSENLTNDQETTEKNSGTTSRLSQTEETGENEEEEYVPDLNGIYKKQGVLQTFFYEKMDFSTLKNLARAILKYNNDIERTPSNEIFGEEVIQHYEKSQAPTPSTTSSKKSPKTPKGKKVKSELDEASEFFYRLMTSKNSTAGTVSLKDETMSMVYEGTEASLVDIEPQIVILPGQNGWHYADFPIFEGDAIALSNLWEAMESKYIQQLQDILWEIKKNEQVILPYINFVKNTLNEVPENDVDNSTEKIVKDFIQYLNNVIKNKPFCEQTSKSLSNGAFNLEMRLWEISNETREKAETQRRGLIEQSWTANEMIDIGKTFMSLIETEAKRSNETLDIICRYYGFMCGLRPADDLPGIYLPDLFESECERELCTVRCAIERMLTDRNDLNIVNPVCEALEKTVASYLTEITRLKSQYDNIIENNKTYLLNFSDEHRTNNHEIYRSFINETEEEDLTEEGENDFKRLLKAHSVDVENLFLEWNYAVKSELDRLVWRIKIVKGRVIEVLDNLEKLMINMFYKFHDLVIANYLKVNEGIDNLCLLFHSAIDNWSPIEGNVVADGCYVFVEKRVLDYGDLPSFEVIIEQRIKPLCFTIEQLEIIVDRFRCVAPVGIIHKRSLLFIVEDMVIHEQSLFPTGWNDLSTLDLKLILETAFGMLPYVYWKDFVLYCLDIPFPDAEDIIQHKERFIFFDKEKKGTVSYNNYKSITCWFEEDTEYAEQEKYIESLKDFLFSLFKVNDDELDYEDFLLSFSKGKTSAIGFGKALSYLLGKCTVTSDENAYLENILIEYDDMLHKMMREIIDEMIFEALNDLYGVKIEELANSQNDVSLKMNLTTESEVDEITELEQEEDEKKSILDKGSQTVSLTELITDQYIAKNKIFRWTTNVPSNAILYLLEKLVYRTFVTEDTSISGIKQDVLQTLSRLEKESLVHLPSLMEEKAIYTIFLWTNTFQEFSFSGAIKAISDGKCIST